MIEPQLTDKTDSDSHIILQIEVIASGGINISSSEK